MKVTQDYETINPIVGHGNFCAYERVAASGSKLKNRGLALKNGLTSQATGGNSQKRPVKAGNR